MERNEINLNDVSPMMREYMITKKEYEDTILFYRLGDFYEMFFEDALTASHELELTLTGKQAGLSEKIPMCGVPHHAANIYIDKLIDKGYKVAICEQMEDPKQTKGIVKREVIKVISKGTITDTSLINEKDFNYIAGITDLSYAYILSYIDVLIGKVYTEYIPHDIDKLISHLVNLNIKEIVIDETFNVEVKNILKNNYNIYISIYKKEITYNNKEIFEDIKDEKLINNIKLLLSYIMDNQKNDLSHLQKVIYVDSKLYLDLDKECIRNLELVETIRNKDRAHSLLGFMDKTKTAMGSRMLKSFIVSPLKDKDEIIKRQNLVEKLKTEFLLKSELRELLYGIYDLERLSGKVACGSLNARDILQLKNSIKSLPDINNILKELGENTIETFDELYNLLESSINEDAPLTIKEGNIIKDGFNSELDELRSIRSGGKNFISNFEKEEKDRTGIRTLKVGYNRIFGYYIEISKGQLSLVKDEFMYERKQTLVNCERFITPLLKEKENLILNAEEKINSLEYDIFCNIKEEIKKYTSKLQKVSNIIAYYDVISTFAKVAEENNFIKPTINTNNNLHIIGGRHPVVESVIDKEYISNDILMDSKTNILIITGPNMSGKSTYMRQLGIIAVLNQIGSYVPAKECNMPIFDKIFTRIGASDDLTSGESTFMVEMKESSNALLNATSNSLILFDELGRGTSTYDGMSLAGSIIEYISKNIKCKTLFSTHYHELTDLENKFKDIKNVHVTISEENGDITFLHKVLDGPVDKSYGINVAKLAHLPKEVLKRAEELLKGYESRNINSKSRRVIEYQLNFEEHNDKDELREYLKEINVLETTPLKALEILDKIKKDYM